MFIFLAAIVAWVIGAFVFGSMIGKATKTAIYADDIFDAGQRRRLARSGSIVFAGEKD